MINPMNVYIKQLAESVRDYCEKKGIIPPEQYKLDKETVTKIAGCFGCKLVQYPSKNASNLDILNDNTNGQPKETYLKRTESGFEIYYKEFKVMDVLHELGHMFLETDNIPIGAIREFNDKNGNISELDASKFARCLIMPSWLFEKKIVENTQNGVCDIAAVAEAFDVDYVQVVSHGRETYLWN